MDATVVKMQTSPTRMRFVTVWKYCEQQWFQNITKGVLCVVIVVLSHQINDEESIDSPNNGQHEVLGSDLLFPLWRDIISRYAPFCKMTEIQSETVLVLSHKSLNSIEVDQLFARTFKFTDISLKY
jgi:hypothetical protein